MIELLGWNLNIMIRKHDDKCIYYNSTRLDLRNSISTSELSDRIQAKEFE